MNRKQSFIAATPLFVFAVLALVFFVRLESGADPQLLPSALVGKEAPDFSLSSIKGADVPGLATADLKTGKMTLVNVWSSWCVPCRAEHPILQQLAKENKNRKFQLVGINYKDAPDNALKFLQETGNPFSKIGADENGRAAIDWGVYGVPESFIVDGTGRIVFKQIGPITPKALEKEILPRLRGSKL